MPGNCSTAEGVEGRQGDWGAGWYIDIGAAGRGAQGQGVRMKEARMETQSPAGPILSRNENGTYLPCHINDKQ